jgi:hypothetical protein
VAAVVYEQRDPETGAYLRDPNYLTDPKLDTEEKIRDHLLSLFIPATVAAYRGSYASPLVHRWLGVLAGYLNGNLPTSSGPGRAVAGKPLSGADLTLHELWPLAGSRVPRLLTTGLMAIIWVGLELFQITSLDNWLTLRKALSSESWIAVAVVTIGCAWLAWPSPRRADLSHLRTRPGRRKLAARFAAGFAIGCIPGSVYGAIYGLAYGFAYRYGLELKFSLGFGIGFGLVIGLGVGTWLALGNRFDTGADTYSAVNPRRVIRDDFIVGIVLGVATWVAADFVTVLALWFAPTFHVGLAPRFAIVLAGLFLAGLASWRYIALLLCTRRWSHHWLPWRLGKFLDWCYTAGLVRVAGISYQFRHRELQDYLARNPLQLYMRCLTAR